MEPAKNKVIAHFDKPLPLNPEMRDFLKRRTIPFLNEWGLSRAPLSFVLEEVYLQGMRDTIQALRHD